MSVYRYVRLDVFSNQPFTGIQLAMFPDAAGIDERRMQRIANEMAHPRNHIRVSSRGSRDRRAGSHFHSNPRATDGRESDDWDGFCARGRGPTACERR